VLQCSQKEEKMKNWLNVDELPKPPKMENLLRVEQVSKILNLAPSTVRRMLWEGKLARVKIGRSTRIREGDVAALIRLGMRRT
jgi:excisionase family DNA binding protein